mgnify:CR=1 FL=1
MGIFEHKHGPGGKVIRKGVETFATATPISEAGGEIINKLKKFKDMAAGFLNFYTFGILIVLIVIVLKFYLNQLDKKDGNAELMKEELEYLNPKILALSDSEYDKNIPIRDYYVMSSYNSCSGGESWQDWVSIDILREVINYGIRCVDLEIYYKNGKCVVAVGPEAQDGKFILKGTYNEIPLDTVLHTINAYAFSYTLDNHTDPFFINLRIKTNNPAVYDKIATSILENIDKRNRINWFNGDATNHNALGNLNDNIKHTVFANLYQRYQDKGFGSKNIIDEPLKKIKGKAIFICNDIATNSFWGEWNDNYYGEQKKNNYLFMACINISNVIGNCMPLRSFKVVYSHNPKMLKKDLKQIIGLSYPDITTVGKNPNWLIHSKYGCQFTLMNFSKRDGELISYLKNFDTAQRALIVKPNHLRFFPIPLKDPKPQKKENSYEKRKCNPSVAFMECL